MRALGKPGFLVGLALCLIKLFLKNGLLLDDPLKFSRIKAFVFA
jgi:hypothetical protein